MPDPVLVPPAIVKTAEDQVSQAKSMYASIKGRTKANLTDAVEVGTLLIAMKEGGKHGKWESVLERVGISSQVASDYMRIAAFAKSRPGGISTCQSINQALTVLSDAGNSNQGDANEGPSKPHLCRQCRIRNTPKTNCKQCRLERAERAAATSGDPVVVPKTPTTPTAPAKPKSGAILFDWRALDNHFGPVARAPDAIAKAFPGEKKSEEYGEVMTHLEQAADALARWKKRLNKSK